MLIPTHWNTLEGAIKLTLGVFVLGILLAFQETPQKNVENPPNLRKHSNAIVQIENLGLHSKGIGSGFFVQRDKVATNIHVIAHSGPVYVRSADKKTTWKVEGVAAYDVKNDLAILKVVGEGETLPLGNSDIIQDGEPISVVGYPGGKYTVAESTLHSIRKSDKWLQMKVDITSGSSGGPVLNKKGQVIGICTVNDKFFSHAIPSSVLKGLLTQSESTETLEQWHKREFIRAYAHFVIGQMYFNNKRFDQAIASLNECLRLNPESIYGYPKRGDARVILGDYKGAMNDYDTAIRLNPQCGGTNYHRGLLKNKLGDYKGAIEDYNAAIRLNPQYPSTYINRGVIKSALGDFEGAISDYNEAIKINPQLASAYINRGDAKKNLGDHTGAIGDCTEAIKINPKLASAYINRGSAKDALGDFEGAISDYNEAIKINPKQVPAYINRGVAKDALGDYKGAIADYDEAIKINPRYWHTYNNRGSAKRKLGDYKGAITDYDKAIKINPQQAIVYHYRGIAKGHLGDYTGAISDYDKAIKLNPKYAQAYYDRARIKETLGQHDAAEADFEKAKELNPDF